MQKFRLFFTLFFLLTSLIALLLIAIFEAELYSKAAQEIGYYFWPVVILGVLFLGLFSGGIVSNASNIEGSLFTNGIFQSAILEFFLLSCTLVYFRYYNLQPGQIILRVQEGSEKDSVNVSVVYNESLSAETDTVTVPEILKLRSSGNYRISIIEKNLVPYQSVLQLRAAKTETLYIPVYFDSKTLIVDSDPQGAEIWINSLAASETPDTLQILNNDTVHLELKLEDYHTYLDTVVLSSDTDLGIIELRKLYTLGVRCRYDDIQFRVYDEENRFIFSGSGSRWRKLPEGRYQLRYDSGEGQVVTKKILLNRNYTLNIP